MLFRRTLRLDIPLGWLTSPKDELGARARNGRDRRRMRRPEIRDKVYAHQVKCISARVRRAQAVGSALTHLPSAFPSY